ncbi:MAG: hydroxyacid dehydrogenase [Chloroflexi bacterium]|nr:hydroxyacid dehydrogenase [Chloroflexota bacterium]
MPLAPSPAEPLAVHLAYAPDPGPLAALRAALLSTISLTTGPDMPNPAVYHVLVAGRPPREMLIASPNLRALTIPFAGLPATTRELLRDFPHVAVYNLHHNAAPTAEMALGLLLAAAKRIVPSDRDFRRHDWTPRYQPYPSMLLAGKRVLVLGYGAVGQRVGAACRVLGMTVTGIRRRISAPQDDGTGVTVYPPDTLHDLLPQTDVLVICLPGTDATTGLIGAVELALLPPGAILVNVGRAAVVEQGALYAALRDGHLFAAGLDVWYTYPTDEASRTYTPPADYPFHELDNVVLSPHRAGGGMNDDIEALRMAALADLLNRLAHGDDVPQRVDLDAGY